MLIIRMRYAEISMFLHMAIVMHRHYFVNIYFTYKLNYLQAENMHRKLRIAFPAKVCYSIYISMG